MTELSQWESREQGDIDIFVPVDSRLERLATEWLLGCGGIETRKVYRRVFHEYCQFVQDRCGLSWENFTSVGAAAFAAQLRAQHERREISAATVARKLASLSAFFLFCLEAGELSRNPLAHVKRPHVAKQPKTAVLSDTEAVLLLEAVRAEREAAMGQKSSTLLRRMRYNEVVFETLLGTGCRIAELMTLRAFDISWEGAHGMLKFRAKGAEDHAVLIPRDLTKLLTSWIASLGVTSEQFLFLQHHTKDSAENLVTRELKRLCEKVGITKTVTPHVLRATVATSLHAQGTPVVHIQRLLNHKDIATTAVYIRRTGEENEAAGLKLAWSKATGPDVVIPENEA